MLNTLWAFLNQFTTGLKPILNDEKKKSEEKNGQKCSSSITNINEMILGVTKQTINAKPRKLSAKWTVEAMADVRPWPTHEIPPISVPGSYSTITEQIIREVIYRYKMRKRQAGFDRVEEELTQAMAVEITKEIDQQIIKDLIKATRVPKELL